MKQPFCRRLEQYHRDALRAATQPRERKPRPGRVDNDLAWYRLLIRVALGTIAGSPVQDRGDAPDQSGTSSSADPSCLRGGS